MNIQSLSTSSINTYNECSWKFFLNYVVKFPSEANKKALLGNMVHHVLEILARAKKTGHYLLKDKYTNIDYLVHIVWQRYATNYANQFLFDALEDKQFIYNQVNYVLNSKFNPLKLKIIESEKTFELNIQISGFERDDGEFLRTRGIVDLIHEIDDDTIEIVDYKTGKRKDWTTGRLKNLDDFQKDLQLRLYALACTCLYKKYKNILVTILYTNDGGAFTVSFSPEELSELIDTLRSKYQIIKNDTKLERLKDDPIKNHWSCHKLCQFGKIEQLYVSKDGELIKKECYPKEVEFLPNFIEKNNKKYYLQSKNTKSYCDVYHDIIKKEGLTIGTQTLINISISAKGSNIKNKFSSTKEIIVDNNFHC